MLNISELNKIENEFQTMFNELQSLNTKIKKELENYSDDKVLKGDELVGWLGEIYGKILFGGTLVNDSFEHDFEAYNSKYSVKTRKGFRNGWTKTSLIRKIHGGESPTYLLFVHLNDDFSIDRIWKFNWTDLVKENRLREKTVRDVMIGWQFSVRDQKDKKHLIIDNRK